MYMITITLENLLSLKSSALIPVICDGCGKLYTKTKQQLYQNNRRLYTPEGFLHKTSCSKECQNIIQQQRIVRTCKCGKQFETIPHENCMFCSNRCSQLGRILSEETKEKIKQAVKLYHLRNPYPVKFSNCIVCNKEFIVKRNRRTCSRDCYKISCSNSGKTGGRVSASKMIRRSQAEIELYNLLSSNYKCLSNQPMFNGWDADVIIPDLKLAILWNGPWHYTKIKQKHSLCQVQNRDRIKLKEIASCGYNYIIVKDFKNKMTPSKAYNSILNYIASNTYNLTMF